MKYLILGLALCLSGCVVVPNYYVPARLAVEGSCPDAPALPTAAFCTVGNMKSCIAEAEALQASMDNMVHKTSNRSGLFTILPELKPAHRFESQYLVRWCN